MSDALAFVEKYADDLFEFSHYYKYSFTYIRVGDDEVWVTVGGSEDDIYRADLTSVMPLCKIIAEAGSEYASGIEGDVYIDLDTDDVYALSHARLKARTTTT